MYAQNKNVTYIADLPDLEDLESSRMSIQQHGQQHGHPSGMPDKFKKFIRNPMGPPPTQSGMSMHHGPPQTQEYFPPPHQQQTRQQAQMKPSSDSPSCLTIHSHVQSCPICSKFFKNDNTVYIISIVILSIICILLLKRVLNL
jgi:hypothetical protein